MKRTTLLLVALITQLCATFAIPAHRQSARIQQPDGSYVTINVQGDEWHHFQTTSDGYSIVKDQRGFYVYAELSEGRLEPTSFIAHDAAERSSAEQAYLSGVKKYQAPAITQEMSSRRSIVRQGQQGAQSSRRAYDYNNFRGLILLVEFTDRSFSREDYRDILDDMVNKENYTGYDNEIYTGSVRDYFNDNSGGKFQPQFDVVGPVKVNYSQYDCNGTNSVDKILRAAVRAADPDVDFSKYDGNNDGIVDLVFFMMAGYGSCYSGNDERLFWPHRYYLSMTMDGKRLNDYASSVEMYGIEGYNSYYNCIDGIGTICHEFSHVLGLPDFYDTNYETNGLSHHPGEWSLMAGGTDNNKGRTPVGYSLYERYSVGFYDEPEVIDAEGTYELDALYKEGKGYRINSSVNNEFFLFENRQRNGFKWDAFLPGNGMLVHRVDQTDMGVWNYYNTVNANSSRNYYEVLRANGWHNGGTQSDLFPYNNKTELHNTSSPANLKSHDGQSTKWGLSNIKMSNGKITFDIHNTFVLSSISLPETVNVGLGLTTTLTATAVPDYAEYTLTWTSSDETVATVDQEGNVRGISEGTAIITVTSDSGPSAECTVTVEALTPVTVDEFKAQEEGADKLLKLENAEVIYSYTNKDGVKIAYIRDAKGSIMLKDFNFTLNTNDIINGTLFARVGSENNMVQVLGIDGSTNDAALTITAGNGVQPREVAFSNLTEADYADYVVLRGVQLERASGVWVVGEDDRRARLYNVMQIAGISVPSNISGKYYDVYAVYATNKMNGNIIEELEMLKAPVEVAAPVSLQAIQLSETTLTMEANESTVLSVTVEPATLADYTVTWESSDPTVATVDDNGTVTAIAAGTCVISVTVTYNNTMLTASCELTVQEQETIIELEPIGVETTVDLSTLGGQELTNVVVNDIYFNIDGDSYDTADGSIVISQTTDMGQIADPTPGSADIKNNFTGLILKVGRGFGHIKVNALTTGNVQIAIQIGNDAPTLATLTERGDITADYDVAEDTYIYIYAVTAPASSPSQRAPKTDTVRFYSVTTYPGVLGISTVQDVQSAGESYFTLNGQRLQGRPTAKGIYIVNGHKVAKY